MSLSNKQWEFLKDVSKLIQKAEELGIKMTGGELYRTKYQQEYYLEKGMSKTRRSKHLSRLAIDFNFFDSEGNLTYDVDYVRPLGEFWESLREGNQAGMFWTNFKDVPHFQA